MAIIIFFSVAVAWVVQNFFQMKELEDQVVSLSMDKDEQTGKLNVCTGLQEHGLGGMRALAAEKPELHSDV